LCHALGAAPDANGCAVNFDHFSQHKRARADNLDVRFASPLIEDVLRKNLEATSSFLQKIPRAFQTNKKKRF
jgi:hypothetical protein